MALQCPSAIHQEFARLDTDRGSYIESSEAMADAALAKDFATIAKHDKLSMTDFTARKARHSAGSRGAHLSAPAAVPMQHSTNSPLYKPYAGSGLK